MPSFNIAGNRMVYAKGEKVLPVWSAARFALILGKDSFLKMETAAGGSSDLRYAKYVLERSNSVDMNDPDVLAMIESLSPSIISAEKLAVLKGE